VINSAAEPTFCLINNNDTTTAASVLLDVTSSEGAFARANQSLRTVAPSTPKLLTFTGNSASLAGGTPVDVTTLEASNRYSVKVSVTTHPANVTVSCMQMDPITCKAASAGPNKRCVDHVLQAVEQMIYDCFTSSTEIIIAPCNW
jgi:hypothetical protein